MSYKSCPRCFAEFYTLQEECFSCGLQLDSFEASQESEKKQVAILLGNKELDISAESLTVGMTIVERYSILHKDR